MKYACVCPWFLSASASAASSPISLLACILLGSIVPDGGTAPAMAAILPGFRVADGAQRHHRPDLDPGLRLVDGGGLWLVVQLLCCTQLTEGSDRWPFKKTAQRAAPLPAQRTCRARKGREDPPRRQDGRRARTSAPAIPMADGPPAAGKRPTGPTCRPSTSWRTSATSWSGRSCSATRCASAPTTCSSTSAPVCRRCSTSSTRRCSMRASSSARRTMRCCASPRSAKTAGTTASIPTKPPVIVVDPRAGHGPGIGGFKRDSEVGMALHDGHPVYFVIFFPEPCPGQTLADVLARAAALRRRSRRPASRQAAGALRQLPGRLGGDAAVRRLRGSGRAGGAERLAVVLLGGRVRREPDASRRRASRRRLARRISWPISATDASTAPGWCRTSRTSSPEARLGEVRQPLHQDRHASTSAFSSSSAGGTASTS